jgi:putative oxidoreductase
MMQFGDFTKRVLTSKYLALAFRLYIGGIFIYASMNKINYTAEFSETIASYQLVPFWLVNLLAVVMPWAELICGILLITGIKSKSATAALGMMLTIFSVAIFSSLLRNIPIGCGCFSSVEETMSWTTLLRDLAWLAMSVHIYFFDSALQLDKRFLLTVKDV